MVWAEPCKESLGGLCQLAETATLKHKSLDPINKCGVGLGSQGCRQRDSETEAKDDQLEIPGSPTEVGMRVGEIWRGTKSS